MTEIEYLQKRLELTENIIESLGSIIGEALPSIAHRLGNLGESWTMDLDILDRRINHEQ